MSGYLRKRGEGSWTVQLELLPDPHSGERRRRVFSVHGTRKDAERALTAAEYERDHGIDIAPDKATLAQLLERWLRDYVTGRLAPSTRLRYTALVQSIVDAIGGVRVQDLKPAHVQSLHAQLLARGLAPRTVVHHHRVLREGLAWAIRMQLLGVNVADAVPPPKPDRREMHITDAEGVSRLLAGCRTETERSLVYVAVQTGLRLGELLGLRWGDLDLEHGQAAIQRSAQYLDRALSFRQTKTARGRSIALSPDTVDALRSHRREQLARRAPNETAQEDTGLVFADDLGQPLRPYAVSAAFRTRSRAAGLDLRFHDLRHTSASLALRAGVHPKVVSERLGHASVQITLDTYSHVLPNLQAEAALALDAFVRMPAPAETRVSN